MAVTFPDEIHPKHKLRLRFDYKIRAYQYLEFFKITISYPTYEFLPLRLTFDSDEELNEFLCNRGIVFDEIDVSSTHSRLSKEMTIVDTSKIYDVKTNISNYLQDFKYYSINEVAEMLSFSRPTIYKLINEGMIKAIRINRQMRIKHSDLTAYIDTENRE